MTLNSLLRAAVLAVALTLPLAPAVFAAGGEGCAPGHGLCQAPEAYFGPDGQVQIARTYDQNGREHVVRGPAQVQAAQAQAPAQNATR